MWGPAWVDELTAKAPAQATGVVGVGAGAVAAAAEQAASSIPSGSPSTLSFWPREHSFYMELGAGRVGGTCLHTESPGESEGMRPPLLSQKILDIVGTQRPTQIP